MALQATASSDFEQLSDFNSLLRNLPDSEPDRAKELAKERLCPAISAKHFGLTERLLEFLPKELHSKYSSLRSPLWYAVNTKSVQMVQLVVSHMFGPTQTEGQSKKYKLCLPIEKAIIDKLHDILRLITDNLTSEDLGHLRALHVAASACDLKATEILLERMEDRDVGAIDHENKTALHIATDFSREKMISSLFFERVLKERISDVYSNWKLEQHYQNLDDVSQLVHTITQNPPPDGYLLPFFKKTDPEFVKHVELTNLLITHTPRDDLAKQDNKGRTALHIASLNGFFEAAQSLISRMLPQEIGLQDHSGKTAFHYCLERLLRFDYSRGSGKETALVRSYVMPSIWKDNLNTALLLMSGMPNEPGLDKLEAWCVPLDNSYEHLSTDLFEELFNGNDVTPYFCNKVPIDLFSWLDFQTLSIFTVHHIFHTRERFGHLHGDQVHQIFDKLSPEQHSFITQEQIAQSQALRTTPHVVLELQPGATQSQVRKAYARLARLYHPDRGGNNEKMQELNEAYEALSEKDTD